MTPGWPLLCVAVALCCTAAIAQEPRSGEATAEQVSQTPESSSPQPEASPSSAAPPQGRPIPGIRTQPQPGSPEEAAAYEKIRAEQGAAEKVRLIEDFLLQYPDSPMKELLYQAAMQAYQSQNDYNQMLLYGELALGENPDSLTALLTLASALAETTGRGDPELEEKLDSAEDYATRALDVIERTRKPPGVPEEAWNRNQHEYESTAHAARGLVALLREDIARAELELKEAVALTARPDPILLYRLGLAYSLQRKYDEAVEALQRAVSLGGVKLPGPDGKPRDLVVEALDFANRQRASATPPAAQEPAEPMLQPESTSQSDDGGATP